MGFTGQGDFTIHTVATNHTVGILHVPDSLATTALGNFLIHTVALDHRLSYKPVVGQRNMRFVSLLHSVHRLPSNAARVVYCSLATSVLRLGSAHFGSTRHGMEKHRWKGGGCLPIDVPSTTQYVCFLILFAQALSLILRRLRVTQTKHNFRRNMASFAIRN
jgi:hypothetical protein